jgi:ribosomal protein S7
MAQQGFLLIADITGYTMFLTRSELEHAQGILDALFKSIFAEIKPPIMLSNLQGDAALTYLPDANLPQRQFPLDAIERIYCSFANTLGAMRLNTTCTCNACRNMNLLDLKFFLHHGTYATQEMAGRTELQGAEVIRLHRLMKNSVTAATGIKAYALVTEQAADAIGLPDFFAGSIRHVENLDEFGETVCYVYDLAPIFALWRATRRVVVQHDEPLAFESMECDLPVPPAIAWAYVTDIEKKTGGDPVATLKRAVENVRPALEVKSRRVGGATYQVPVEVRPERRTALAMRWLISYSRDRNEKSMPEKLAAEIISASKGEGNAVKKKEDTHRMADANKAFAHYKW